jgi:hypothetical protein
MWRSSGNLGRVWRLYGRRSEIIAGKGIAERRVWRGLIERTRHPHRMTMLYGRHKKCLWLAGIAFADICQSFMLT